MKKAVSMALAFVLAFSLPVCADTRPYTDEQIEKRITEVGEEYLNFLRENSLSMLEEDGSALYEEAAEADAEAGSGSYAAPRAASAKSTADASTMIPVPFSGQEMNTEEYAPVNESGFVSVRTQPFSTFGADVDTASYSSLRRRLMEPYIWSDTPYFRGIDDSAIRAEEMLNYFTYHYAEPEDGEKFGVTTALCPCPWNEETLLLKVGIKAGETVESAGSNIVFLVDTSGSMFDFDKLPLVKTSLGILLDQLTVRDTISIVTYAGSEEVVAEGVRGDRKEEIKAAIDSLEAWGSTWGEGGIQKAYEIAGKYLIRGGNNRVILCTDGDFNVGVSSEAGLKDLISGKRESGVFFSCLGFGGGNYSDTTMETLADNGNGNYFYIDCVREAERALREEFFSTIYTVAKDTKFQVEFNPDTVKGYRLIGYENRKMAAEDFADDTKDGGEVGAGESVTVLYEVVPAGSAFEIPDVSSRYGQNGASEKEYGADDELLSVNIRYKEPDADESELRVYPVTAGMLSAMDDDTSWAAGVAEAAMIMRQSEYLGTSTLESVYERLKQDPDIMENDYKAEFLFLIRLMKQNS